jgi:lipoprotein-anchoring transpeptidase ErfK/SrfK
VSDLKRHAIFFYYGFANNISQPGGPASHGCVRLHPANAATLFGLVQHSGPRDTTIQISNEAIDLAYRARLD